MASEVSQNAVPLSLGWGGFFSDRIVASSQLGSSQFQVCNSWASRLFFHTTTYQEENRRTVEAFKSYLVERLGEHRLRRLCTRVGVDLDEKIRCSEALFSADIAKVVVGAQDVTIQDMEGALLGVQRGESWVSFLPSSLRSELVHERRFLYLSPDLFSRLRSALSTVFSSQWKVERIQRKITGKATETLANFFHDPFLARRERLQLGEGLPLLGRKAFYEILAKRVIKKEMEVGDLVPAYRNETGSCFFRVAARLITAEGLISYTLVPATYRMPLSSIRLFRGSSFHPSHLDALSCLVTDLETDFGRSAYESGRVFERHLREVAPVSVEIGHSLGGTIVQYRASEDPSRLQELFLFNSPGVSREAVERFRVHNPCISLIIRESKHDSLQRLGAYLLGYQAPMHVRIDYLKCRMVDRLRDTGPHSFFISELSNPVIKSNYTREKLDRKFDHLRKGKWEKIRRIIGPYLLSPLFAAIKAISRAIFGARCETMEGLSRERLTERGYLVQHLTRATVLQDISR